MNLQCLHTLTTITIRPLAPISEMADRVSTGPTQRGLSQSPLHAQTNKPGSPDKTIRESVLLAPISMQSVPGDQLI